MENDSSNIPSQSKVFEDSFSSITSSEESLIDIRPSLLLGHQKAQNFSSYPCSLCPDNSSINSSLIYPMNQDTEQDCEPLHMDEMSSQHTSRETLSHGSLDKKAECRSKTPHETNSLKSESSMPVSTSNDKDSKSLTLHDETPSEAISVSGEENQSPHEKQITNSPGNFPFTPSASGHSLQVMPNQIVFESPNMAVLVSNPHETKIRVTTEKKTKRNKDMVGKKPGDNEIFCSISSPAPSPPPPPLPVVPIKNWLPGKKTPDFVVVIDKKEFSCHLFTLGLFSDYFSKFMYVHGNDIPHKLPKDYVSVTAFHIILEWIQEQLLGPEAEIKCLLTQSNVLEVYVAAKYLGMCELEKKAWEYINSLEVKRTERYAQKDARVDTSIFELYVEAAKRHLLQVLEVLTPKVGKIFLLIVATEEYLKLPVDAVIILLKSDEICVNSELEVYAAATCWLLEKWSERHEYIIRLMQCVRFGLLSSWRLWELLEDIQDPTVDDYTEMIRHHKVQELIKAGLGVAILREAHGEDKDKYKRSLQDHCYEEPCPRQLISVMLDAENKAATTIQAYYRGYKTRRSVENQRIAANKIQARYRGFIIRKSLQEQQTAAGKIQALFKGHLVREELRRQSDAAKRIQASYRGYSTRKDLEEEKSAAIVMQSRYRGHLARKNIQKQNAAASKIQKFYRAFREKKSVLKAHFHYDRETPVILGGADLTLPYKTIQNMAAGVYIYSADHNMWDFVGKMPEPRVFHQAVFMMGRIYVIGGKDPRICVEKGSFQVVGTTWSLDPVAVRWRRECDLITPRARFGVGVLNGRLYAVGGETNHNEFLSSVECFNPATGKWTEVAPLKLCRMGLAVTAYDGKLWAAGGVTWAGKPILTRKVDCYIPEEDTWQKSQSLRFRCCYAQLIVFQGKLHHVGGVATSPLSHRPASINTVDVWDPVMQDWRLKMEMTTARHDHVVLIHENNLLAVGGQTTLNKQAITRDSVECYLSDLHRWLTLNGFCPLPVPLSGHAAASLPPYNHITK